MERNNNIYDYVDMFKFLFCRVFGLFHFNIDSDFQLYQFMDFLIYFEFFKIQIDFQYPDSSHSGKPLQLSLYISIRVLTSQRLCILP